MRADRLAAVIPAEAHLILRDDDHPTPEHIRNVLLLARSNPRFDVDDGVADWVRDWVESRPVVQERGMAALTALTASDREVLLDGRFPEWRLADWADDLLWPWGERFDAAVSAAEELLGW